MSAPQPARSGNTVFADRLSELCETKSSVSEICRDLGINRQQFARYQNGSSIPRQALLAKIAAYFEVDQGVLYSEHPVARNTTPHKRADIEQFSQLLDCSGLEEITERDLSPGYYVQHKRSFSVPDQYIRTLVAITNDNGVYKYKTRVISGNTNRSTGVTHYYEGVFIKQNGFLVMADNGNIIPCVTFHVFKLSNGFDTMTKPGLHMTVGLPGSTGPKCSRLVIEKIKRNESVLHIARTQGMIDKSEVPEYHLSILERDTDTIAGQISI